MVTITGWGGPPKSSDSFFRENGAIKQAWPTPGSQLCEVQRSIEFWGAFLKMVGPLS